MCIILRSHSYLEIKLSASTFSSRISISPIFTKILQKLPGEGSFSDYRSIYGARRYSAEHNPLCIQTLIRRFKHLNNLSFRKPAAVDTEIIRARICTFSISNSRRVGRLDSSTSETSIYLHPVCEANVFRRWLILKAAGLLDTMGTM